MKIALVGTYPPRECGIGTFTHNKFMAMVKNNADKEQAHEGFVVAVNDHENKYGYPHEVQFVIRQEKQADYVEAAAYINNSGAEVCIIEHEYGIYGGHSGIYILSLMHRLKMPIIAVMHTVVKTPSYNERAILKEIAKMAAKTVVMSQKAVDFMIDIYGVADDKIEKIEHGVPDIYFDKAASKKEFGLQNKQVLLTFGLIGRNKGLETAIKSLPSVVAKHPQLVYIILGKTHPHVVRHSGEEYRNYLQQLVKELGLENNVVFENKFVNEQQLFKYLCAADIYVTPYPNEAQVTSGTLSYAVGARCAVVSTPYWHAAELLAEGRGRLFGFNNHNELANVLLDLLGHPESMEKMKCTLDSYRHSITWPKTGEKYFALARQILKQLEWQLPVKSKIFTPAELPPFSLQHVRRLTDSTGIIQHAWFCIPNLKEGYCLDDNARALLLALMAIKQKKQQGIAMEMLPAYLSYIYYMQNEDGTFRNFLSFNRNFLDEVGSEDAFGRAIWALGYLIDNAPNDGYYQSGREIFFRAARNFNALKYTRSIANTIIGICYYLRNCPGDNGMNEVLKSLAYKLAGLYGQHKTESWHWFEPQLTYDNAVLPLSLLHAAEILRDEKLMKTAVESMEFLTNLTGKNDYLSIIGNENWYVNGCQASVYAQQPVDVMGMVLMFQKALHITKDQVYFTRLYSAYKWFLGENDLRIGLYDHDTKGCCDGLESYGVNRNQGAESTLAYLISHLAVLQAFAEHSYGENSVKALPQYGHTNGYANGMHNANGKKVKVAAE